MVETYYIKGEELLQGDEQKTCRWHPLFSMHVTPQKFVPNFSGVFSQLKNFFWFQNVFLKPVGLWFDSGFALLEFFLVILDPCQPPPNFPCHCFVCRTLVRVDDSQTHLPIPPKATTTIIAWNKFYQTTIWFPHALPHFHGKTFHSPMQYFQIYSDSLLCHFQSRNYLHTFHSSKNSEILVRCMIYPPEQIGRASCRERVFRAV